MDENTDIQGPSDITRALSLVDARHSSIMASWLLCLLGVSPVTHSAFVTMSVTEMWSGVGIMATTIVTVAYALIVSDRLGRLMEDRPALAPIVAAAEGTDGWA